MAKDFATRSSRPLWAGGDVDAALFDDLSELFSADLRRQSYAPGDITYAKEADTLATLDVGIPGDLLMVSADNLPLWSAALTGDYIFSGDVTFDGFIRIDTWAEGSIGYTDIGSIFTELTLGTSSPVQVLGVNAGQTAPQWRTASTYLAHDLLSPTHTDTIAGVVTEGDIIIGDGIGPAAWRVLLAGAPNAIMWINPVGGAGAGPIPAWAVNATYDDTLREWRHTGGSASITGSDVISGTLTLTGSTDANEGYVDVTSGFRSTNNPILSADPILEKTPSLWNPTIGSTGATVMAQQRNTAAVTVDNGTFIYGSVYELSTFNFTVAPGFSVFTLFLAQADLITTTALIRPTQAFVLGAQVQMSNDGAGAIASAIPTHIGVHFGPRMRCTTSGDTLTVTAHTGLNVAPTYSTVGGTIISFGTIRGVHLRNPAVGLFQPSGGLEGMVAYYGLDMDNITFGGNVTKAAVHSAQAAATNAYFLLNTGTAQSDFGDGDIHFNDNNFVMYGGGMATPDVVVGWASAQSAMTWSTFFGLGAAPLYLEPGATDEWVFRQHSAGALDIGIGFDVNAIVFGTTAPTPNSNNWFVQFAAPNARQVQIGGEYSDVLWTAGGFIDVNGIAVTDLQAYKINSPSIVLNGGTIADLSNLYVAAMPSFGGTRMQALRVLGRTRADGLMCHNEATLATLTADVAALALPANNLGRFVLLMDADASGPWTVQGIVNVQVGDAVYIVNTGANAFDFGHLDGAAAPADQIITPTAATWTLGPREFAKLWYDPVAVNWRILESNGA